MHRISRGLPLLLLLLALPDGAAAQETFSPRCQADAFRQFDFWLGQWEVTGLDGQVVGESVIDRILGGCVVRERWTAGEVEGTSHNIFDAPSGTWNQTWVDNRGILLRLRGAFDGTSMVLRGERLGGDGKVRVFQTTWTPLEDGGVRQLAEVSEDGGATWGVNFEGVYRPLGG